MSSSVLEKFVEEDYFTTYWEQLARDGAKMCNELLSRDSIKDFTITSRAKSRISLKKKLLELNKTQNFQNKQEILDAITDLAGISIELNNPRQSEKVCQLLEEVFIIEKISVFGPPPDYKVSVHSSTSNEKIEYRASREYKGKHLLVVFKTAPNLDYKPSHKLEIQIHSGSYVPWMKADHHMVYKRVHVEHSEKQSRMLGYTNQLAAISEGLLQDVYEDNENQMISFKRPFGSIRDLSVYLHNKINPLYIESTIYGLEMLYPLLLRLNRDSPETLLPIIQGIGLCDPSPDSSTSCFSSTIESYRPFQPKVEVRISFAIISYILCNFLLEEDNITIVQPDDPYSRYTPCYMCEVLLSALLWLQDISPKSSDACEMCRKAGMPEEIINSGGFRWLLSGSRRISILENIDQPSNLDKKDLSDIWTWFQTQRNTIFALLYSVAMLGLIRDVLNELIDLGIPDFGGLYVVDMETETNNDLE